MKTHFHSTVRVREQHTVTAAFRTVTGRIKNTVKQPVAVYAVLAANNIDAVAVIVIICRPE